MSNSAETGDSADVVSTESAGDLAAHLSSHRRSYVLARLEEDSAATNWLDQLKLWYGDAVQNPGTGEPNAMQVATVDPDGHPDVRTVLARDFSESGVTFFTNYSSAKAQQLAFAAFAAAVFNWPALERQVRFRGPVTRVSADETAEYFVSRPRGAQLGAWASPQSQVIADRTALHAMLDEVTARFGDGPIPPPPFWGGYRIAIREMEFWQGREFRLHDRLRFRRDDGDGWLRERLAP